MMRMGSSEFYSVTACFSNKKSAERLFRSIKINGQPYSKNMKRIMLGEPISYKILKLARKGGK